MQRRDFVKLLGGAAVWPLAASAQQPSRVRRIGILDTAARDLNKDIAALFEGLRNLGYIEGQNLIVEYRSADGRDERLS
jgi:putative ABC transport system substrate-binding protein